MVSHNLKKKEGAPMSMKARAASGKATVLEKIIYGIGDIGANFGWTFMTLFITMYYTDSVGLSTAFAGTMMLITRIFDGVSDVVFASIMEKSKFKMGKIRPWFLIAAPLMGIGIYLCFHVPMSLSLQGRQIYSFATYFFMAVISYTIYSIAYTGFLPLMSQDSNDRNIISAMSRIFTMAGILVMNIITPILLGVWGGERVPEAWGNLTTIYAIFCTVMVAMMGLCIKEKPVDGAEGEITETEKPPLKAVLGTVFKVKYFWILAVMFIMFYLSTGLNGISTYFYRDVLGNLDLLGTMSFLGVVPTLIVMPFVPAVFKKLGKRKTCIISLSVTILSDLIAILMPHQFIMFCISRVLNSVFKIPYSAAVFIFVADLVDHVWQRNSIRAESFISMASSVGQKIGAGFGGALVGWGLTWAGYNAASTMQSSATQFGITLIFFGIPMLCNLIALIMVNLWRIGDPAPGLATKAE